MAVESLLVLAQLLLGLAAQGHVVRDVGRHLAAVHGQRAAADLDLDQLAVLAPLLYVERMFGPGIMQAP